MLTLGSRIPNLVSTDQQGNSFSFEQLIGQKCAVYFYPKDDTPGCTAQACSIRDGESLLLASGIQVVGVSADSVSSHQKFITKYNLSFPLLSDPTREIIEAFGVWGQKKFMGKVYDGIHRTTFLFNTEGELIHVIEKPNTKNHAEEIIKIFNEIA